MITSTDEVREAIAEPVAAVVDAVKVTLEKTPPELAADIMEQGIVLAGGGALLHGLKARLQSEAGMPIRRRHPARGRHRLRPVPGGLRERSRACPLLVLQRTRPPGAWWRSRGAPVAPGSTLLFLVLTSITRDHARLPGRRRRRRSDRVRDGAADALAPVRDVDRRRCSSPVGDACRRHHRLRRPRGGERRAAGQRVADLEGQAAAGRGGRAGARRAAPAARGCRATPTSRP